MLKKILRREVILYLFFGGLTTLVGAVVYFFASWGLGLSAWLSSIISWVFAASFAFVTNKIIVFKSKTATKKETTKQASLFFVARLATLGINTAIMLVFVDIMRLNEAVIFVIGQLVVLTLNYLASKLVIFKN